MHRLNHLFILNNIFYLLVPASANFQKGLPEQKKKF